MKTPVFNTSQRRVINCMKKQLEYNFLLMDNHIIFDKLMDLYDSLGTIIQIDEEEIDRTALLQQMIDEGRLVKE